MNKTNRFLSLAILASLVLVLAFGVTQPVQAFEINNNGKIASGVVIDDDLIIGGNTVVIDGTVNGMVLAGGNDVIINGTVNGDVLAAGSSVTIGEGAKITGNLFAGAQTVVINGNVAGSVMTGVMSLVLNGNSSVGRNLYFGGYSLETKSGAKIGRDLAAGGYQVILSGAVTRDVKAAVSAFKLDGSIGRNAEIQVDKPGQAKGYNYPGPWSPQTGNMPMYNPGLDIGKDASIGGNLVYTSPVDQTSGMQSTPQGTTVFQTPVPSDTKTTTSKPDVKVQFEKGIFNIFKNMAKNFISLMALGALALWLIPLSVKGVSDMVGRKTLPSLGYGILAYIVGWVGTFFGFLVVICAAIILGVISFGGLAGIVFWSGTSTLLMAFTVFMGLILWGTKIIAVFLAGRFILERLFKQSNANRFLSLLIGVIIYVPLRAVPILGFLLDVFVTFVGLGAIWIYFRERSKPAPTAAVPVPAPAPEIPAAS
jgi:cytoskeletal protein CcmA (bactofilin family)